jgi:hypothetical protein
VPSPRLADVAPELVAELQRLLVQQMPVRAGILMAPLLLLNGDMEIGEGRADENELLEEALDMIPTCIAGIHEFWRNYRKPQSRRGRSKPGGDRRRLH